MQVHEHTSHNRHACQVHKHGHGKGDNLDGGLQEGHCNDVGDQAEDCMLPKKEDLRE